MKKNLLLLACSTLFALLLLEAAIGLGTTAGLFNIKVPSYSLDQAHGPAFHRDMNPDFGVWHNANIVRRHIKSCFDVTYRTNSYGARDAERSLQSDKRRVVVLGDSMTEGYGVADWQRFTNVLERKTGIEQLNFGIGGSFGTTQYYLLYKTLAIKFDHVAVMIAMLPNNDFQDNDYEFGKQVYPNRYRPYLVGEYPNYRLLYHQSSIESSSFGNREGRLGPVSHLLREFTYGYNAFAYYSYYYFKVRQLTMQQARDPPSYSGFYDFRKDQLELVKYAFEQIKRTAGGDRDIVIVLLPTLADLKRYTPGTVPLLSTELGKFAAANGMQLVDLLPDMYRHTKDWDSYFLPCDGHWNEQGHAVAAHYLMAKLAPR
jgi:lysophospholipase L1-like esterase